MLIAGEEGAAQTTSTTTTTTNGPKPAKKQTNPPSIPICELYPDGNFPQGQIVPHGVPKDQDEWVLILETEKLKINEEIIIFIYQKDR